MKKPGDPITGHFMDYPKKILWAKVGSNELRAYNEVAPRGFESGLREEDMDPIQQWSTENKCGVRISFDTWKFKNPREITMFLLRWT